MLNKFKYLRLFSHGFLGSLALIIATGFGRADTLDWVAPPPGTLWNGTYYIGPYSATDQSTYPPISLYCLDFNDEINPPAEWLASLNLLAPSNISQFQFGSYPDAYHRYLEAAWLFTNMIGAHAQSDTNDVMVSQVAAWLLFVDNAHVGELNTQIGETSGAFSFADYVGSQGTVTQLTFSDAVNAAVNASQNAVLLGGWTAGSNWMVVTGDPASNGGQPIQEFLTPVPEPGSILSTGTFLLGAWLIWRKSRRRS